MDFGIIGQWLVKNVILISLIDTTIILVGLFYFIMANSRLRKYRQLLRSSNGRDLETVLLNYSETTQFVASKINQFEQIFNQNLAHEAKHIQKVGLVRFKAFQNSGGDQSFALALLDADGDGIVMSSIFGREEARVYCKPVSQGTSTYPISEEEKEAIEKAMGTIKK
ncbi:MAG: DUF4446 family protein [Firmicutes bacterium]|nr:DUF4446 family protein [Bacillota bacterium]